MSACSEQACPGPSEAEAKRLLKPAFAPYVPGFSFAEFSNVVREERAGRSLGAVEAGA